MLLSLFFKLYNVYRANLTLYNPLRAASMSRQDYIDHKKCQVHEFPSKNVIVYARGMQVGKYEK